MKTKVTDVQASGILDSTTFLRGDGQWATPAGGVNNYVVASREVISYTGADETYTVPAGIIRLRIHAWGGAGQGGQYGGGEVGGGGGYTVAEINVTPGDTLELQVGQGGQWTGFSTQNPGGWPDGGDGSYGDTSGGGGGGSTRVFNSLNDLLLIAGAGGGSAGYIGNGGPGGGTTGGNASAGGATGGSQSAGGTSGGGGDPGTGPVDYASRATQRGGNGGPTGSTSVDGGGGGGGYYGGAGGGGDGKAGAGGSGFFDPALVEDGSTTAATGGTPPATSVTGYVAGVGVGSASGSGLDGGDGLIVIEEMIAGMELGDLYNVDVPSPTDGQVLTFNATTQKWEAVDPTGGGGGGGGGAYVLLDEIELSALASSVTFASISQSYQHLKILIEIVSDGVSSDAQINTRFNNDSGANYSGYLQNAFGSGTSTTELSSGLTPTSGGISFSEADIFDYSSTLARKQQLFRSTTQSSTSFNQWGGGYWDDAAPITEIDLIRSNAGNWGIGSRFRLYGWKSDAGAGGGGFEGWEIVDSWEHSVSGNTASKIVDVSDYTDILIIGNQVTASTSGWRGARFSLDGGATYVSSNSYTGVDDTGVVTPAQGAAFFHSTAATAVRSFHYSIDGIDLVGLPKRTQSNRAASTGFFGTTALSTLGAITHIRLSIVDTAGAPIGTMNSGSIYVLGRKKTTGGGGGQPWWFQPPVVAGFTTAFGGAHGWATLADDTDEGLLFDAGAPESGDKTIYAYQTIPSPGSDWTLTVRLSVSLPSQNFSAMGIICQNSANSRIVLGSLASGGNAWFMKFFNLNPGSYVGEINAAWNGDPKWLRLAKVGTDIVFYVSSEGKIWSEMARQAIATFLAANPDRIGFAVLHNRSSGPRVVGSIQYWDFQ